MNKNNNAPLKRKTPFIINETKKEIKAVTEEKKDENMQRR